MSAAIIDKEKVYRPISGTEAIDLILTEFHRQLVNSGLFPLHRVWHEFEIAGGVRVKGWGTRTEDVKFRVESLHTLHGDEGNHPADAEQISESIAVQLGPGPPDQLRETLSEFPCGKGCGRILCSKAGKLSHERHCKAELPPPIETPDIDAGGSGLETIKLDPAAPLAPAGPSN